MNSKVLIIDDRKYFRSALADLLKQFGYNVASPVIQVEKIANLIKSFAPDFIILDNLFKGFCASDLLEKLELEHNVDLHKYKYIIITGNDTSYTTELLEQYAFINSVLVKPLDVHELIAEMKKLTYCSSHIHNQHTNPCYSLPHALQSIPLPIRVLNKSGDVVFHNSVWLGPKNRPRPSRFLPFNKTNSIDKLFGFLPDTDSGEIGHYRIVSFLDSKSDESIIQIAYCDEEIPRSMPESIDRVHTIMEYLGFQSGIYTDIVEVPGTNGMMRFPSRVAGRPDAIIQFDGRFRSELDSLLRSKMDQSVVLQCVFESSTIQADLCLLEIVKNFGNDYISGDNLTVIPIVGKADGELRKVVGVFIYPRFQTSRIADGNGPRHHVNCSAAPLIKAFRFIEHERKIMHGNNQAEYFRRLNELDRTVINNSSLTDILQKILDIAVSLTNASGGIVAKTMTNAAALQICACNGLQQSAFRNIILGTNEMSKTLPAFTVWNNKTTYALPSISAEQRDQYFSVYKIIMLENKLPEKLIKQTHDFFCSQLQSLLVNPIAAGDRQIGVLSLHWSTEYGYKKEHDLIINILLHRAKWFLQAALEREMKLVWEQSLVHEFSTFLSTISQILSEAHSCENPCECKKLIAKSNIYITLLCDQTAALHMSTRGYNKKSGLYFLCDSSVYDSFYFVSQELVSHKNLKLNIPSYDPTLDAWSAKLKGSEKDILPIMRNFIHNAYKRSKTGSQIWCNAFTDKDFWYFDVISCSTMNEEEYRLRFTPHVKPAKPLQDGSHVGLFVALMIAQEYGGDVTLENIFFNDQPCVKAGLKWPRYKSGDLHGC